MCAQMGRQTGRGMEGRDKNATKPQMSMLLVLIVTFKEIIELWMSVAYF